MRHTVSLTEFRVQRNPNETGVCVYLQVGCERVREPHVAWEGTEDEVAELDAVRRDNVAEAVMVITQELWEVMQQDQEHSQRALNQPTTTTIHLSVAQKVAVVKLNPVRER